MAQCDKKNCVGRSDSVQQPILKKTSNFFVACKKEIEEKKPRNKHSYEFEFNQRYQIALGYLLF